MSQVVLLEPGAHAGYRLRVGGVTVLERRVRELAKAGVTRVLVAVPPLDFGRVLPIPVEFIADATAAPAELRRERADVLAGIEVHDEATRRAAEWTILRGMNKSFEGPVDALINWRFSMRITRSLAQTQLSTVTPNHITIVAILLGLSAAAVAVTRADYVGFALAGVMLQVNSILDSCDGELARLRFQYSKLGQWLDNLADDVVDNVFICAVGYALGGVWWPLALAGAGGRVLVSIMTYVDVYRRTGTGDVFAFRWWFEADKSTADAVYDPRSPVTWLRSFGRRDTFVFVWMLACVAGLPHWVVGHGLLIGAVQVGLLILHLMLSRPAAR